MIGQFTKEVNTRENGFQIMTGCRHFSRDFSYLFLFTFIYNNKYFICQKEKKAKKKKSKKSKKKKRKESSSDSDDDGSSSEEEWVEKDVMEVSDRVILMRMVSIEKRY